jgi:hypothetical protein
MKPLRREKITHRFFSSLAHNSLNVVPAYNHFFFLPLFFLAQPIFFNKFGSKLGRNWEEKI